MDTGLLDASASIPVAVWFATHDFNSGPQRTADSAVPYRIDRHGLRDVENRLQAISGGSSSPWRLKDYSAAFVWPTRERIHAAHTEWLRVAVAAEGVTFTVRSWRSPWR